MRTFAHINARSLEEACTLLRKYHGKAVLNAGGTDLLATLKAEILPGYPEVVINIKTVPDRDFIREEDGMLTIGSLTTLSDIARSSLMREKYGLLAQAARSVATPQIRNAATIGGNLCQDVRCWYYRYPCNIGGPIGCLRKGNGPCVAVSGDNRYHAILGGRRCFAVCPSDMAVALAALDARITVLGPGGERKVAVTEFYSPLGTALEGGEMVKEIGIPAVVAPVRQRFLKFALRKPVDFAVVSAASLVTQQGGVCSDARIALGAVAPGPVRAVKAEEFLKGRIIDGASAAEAAELAVVGARPLSRNAYKIAITKTLVKRALLD